MAETKYFDSYALSSLKEILAGDFENLLNAYRKDVCEHFDVIFHHLKQDDRSGVLKSVHSLKGSSGNIGALAFSKICENFETSVKDNEDSSIEENSRLFFESKTPLLLEIDSLLETCC
ncbi:Hpt domain-containing protein [Sessilibacter corallicola]|uniref:HPt domain-containing protein n=1 Tax=Sessilibacter corallicola TaxID=2904075 RepID=A0ABQ0AAA8_9GAMM